MKDIVIVRNNNMNMTETRQIHAVLCCDVAKRDSCCLSLTRERLPRVLAATSDRIGAVRFLLPRCVYSIQSHGSLHSHPSKHGLSVPKSIPRVILRFGAGV